MLKKKNYSGQSTSNLCIGFWPSVTFFFFFFWTNSFGTHLFSKKVNNGCHLEMRPLLWNAVSYCCECSLPAICRLKTHSLHFYEWLMGLDLHYANPSLCWIWKIRSLFWGSMKNSMKVKNGASSFPKLWISKKQERSHRNWSKVYVYFCRNRYIYM